ncbi:tripartite motif-containing protein 29-like [Perca flavescens]|uniref:tripartite motif-containing protein 29-like n=1 Tax=Perca flavescens TaxID=8167 RepID=UPI00106EC226|nr:tripartite motif-containing protein 29-like [Perca flavescens]
MSALHVWFSFNSSSSEQQVSKPGEVLCDVCTRTELKALKSCLVCLEPHLTASRLKRNQLIDPVENLEGRMCTKHDKPLELFCKTDQTCVCMLCTVLDHKMHDVVPLKEGYEGKKAELGKTEAEIQQMIQKRRLKIQEIKHSVDLSEEDADREIAEGVQVFTSLKESVERGLNSVQSLNIQQPPPTKDWTEVSVHQSYEGTVLKAVVQLEDTLSKEMKKLLEAELKRVQQYAVDVTES